MTENYKNGFSMIWKGIKTVISETLSLINKVMHKQPYLFMMLEFIVLVVIASIIIGQARAERDYANKRYVIIQNKLDSLTIIKK